MDTSQVSIIATEIGVGVQTLSTVLQIYSTFKRKNIDIFFDKLVKCNKDLRKIGEDENLQRYFFNIIDDVSREANIDKIELWKNAVIHLATDFYDFQYKDNFLYTLSQLTVFDLTVLYKIYTTEFSGKSIITELSSYFESKGIKYDYILQAIKHLSSNNLISENYMMHFTFAGTEDASLQNLLYSKTDLGKEFLSFVIDYNEEVNIK